MINLYLMMTSTFIFIENDSFIHTSHAHKHKYIWIWYIKYKWYHSVPNVLSTNQIPNDWKFCIIFFSVDEQHTGYTFRLVPVFAKMFIQQEESKTRTKQKQQKKGQKIWYATFYLAEA